MSPFIKALDEAESPDKVLIALHTLTVLKKQGILLSANELQKLCQCMLLTLDREKKTCLELQRIEKDFECG